MEKIKTGHTFPLNRPFTQSNPAWPLLGAFFSFPFKSKDGFSKTFSQTMVARNRNHWKVSNHFRRDFSKAAFETIYGKKPNTWVETLIGISAIGFGYYFFNKFSVAQGYSSFNNESLRIRRRLERNKLKLHKIVGDGNCQFRAIADQLYNDQEQHQSVRQQIVSWLSKNGDFPVDEAGIRLKDFQIDFKTWEDYCNYMSRLGSWGDHFTLIGASEVFKISIRVLTSIDCPEDQAETLIHPKSEKSTKTISLLHAYQNHYESLKEIL